MKVNLRSSVTERDHFSAWQEYTKGASLHICPSRSSCLHMPAAQCTSSCKSGLAAVLLHAYCMACLQRGEHQFKIMWSRSKYKLVPLLSLPTFWHKPEVAHIRWQTNAMPYNPALWNVTKIHQKVATGKLMGQTSIRELLHLKVNTFCSSYLSGIFSLHTTPSSLRPSLSFRQKVMPQLQRGAAGIHS